MFEGLILCEPPAFDIRDTTPDEKSESIKDDGKERTYSGVRSNRKG